MSTIGTVESLWRYPVKSMSGEEMTEAFMGFSGIYGDRCFAFKDTAAPKGFPYLTGREQQQMLRYRPRFRNADKTVHPPNAVEAAMSAPGITYANADPSDMAVDVVTPAGKVIAVDDPKLVEMLREDISEKHQLSLVRSDRALTDCRPVSLISLQTVGQLSNELGIPLDKRRFRANIYVDLESGNGYEEDGLVGRKLRVGSDAVLMILERDPRCKMISLDPDSGEHNPDVLRKVAKEHEGYTGVYGAVLIEGVLKPGDPVKLLD